MEEFECANSQYSRFSFLNLTEDQWLSRSLFVLKHHLFLCVEDLKQFSFLSESKASTPYFFLDSSCSIMDISEMVSISCIRYQSFTILFCYISLAMPMHTIWTIFIWHFAHSTCLGHWYEGEPLCDLVFGA